MTISRFAFALAACALPGLASGCAGSKMVPATGIVIYQGQPLAGATVVFAPKNGQSGPVLTGTTDAQGRFTLVTHASSTSTPTGAVPGEYKVTITKFVLPQGITEEEYQEKVKAAGEGPLGKVIVPEKVPLLPPRYSDTTNTELSETIPSGGKTNIKFDLN